MRTRRHMTKMEMVAISATVTQRGVLVMLNAGKEIFGSERFGSERVGKDTLGHFIVSMRLIIKTMSMMPNTSKMQSRMTRPRRVERRFAINFPDGAKELWNQVLRMPHRSAQQLPSLPNRLGISCIIFWVAFFTPCNFANGTEP